MKNKINNVLSLFDGMSCGQIALNALGIMYGKYYASEIDKFAMKATQHNYPNTIQVGSVIGLNGKDFTNIDLLIGGSPCQSFSSSGKGEGFKGKSGLFWEYVRILKEVKPKYFLLENVNMRAEWRDIITDALGVEPILINSALVSAQNRNRLYWTNIPNVAQPTDKYINLMDVFDEGYDRTLTNKATIVGRRLDDRGKRQDYDKTIPITQCLEVRASNIHKSNCLTTVAKDNVLTSLQIGRHPDAYKNNLPYRHYTTTEYCRLQTIPIDYFSENIVSDSQLKKMVGNAWTVDVIAHIFKNMESV